MRIVAGFPETQRARAAELFWEAFSGKLGRLLRPEGKARDFLERALSPEHALSALSDNGELLGIAGFKTLSGGLVSAGYADIARVYGRVGALWRGPALDLLERPLTERQLLMDGLFVAGEARGMGLGSALIDAVIDEAARRDMDEVRLDVIDGNPRARALYERHGFRPAGQVDLGPFRWLFGFRHSTTMRRRLHPQ
ncbi:MAG: GNAT family N-acetyltransferase [Tropicimonas sp.]|uniref:GNAT family N-acetyltransferase n=1 Tax=Tropicimonas sp. TaxID=2067044 RepID=UPI003A836E61